jgi:hypothetical protein
MAMWAEDALLQSERGRSWGVSINFCRLSLTVTVDASEITKAPAEVNAQNMASIF